jgi:hypothetical protein
MAERGYRKVSGRIIPPLEGEGREGVFGVSANSQPPTPPTPLPPGERELQSSSWPMVAAGAPPPSPSASQ